MMKNQLKWYVVDSEYVSYLKSFDSLVQNINYGTTKLKPYIGIIMEVNNFFYFVPVSSAKPKHRKMKDTYDMVIIKDEHEIKCVLNLNNMIPVPKELIKPVDYSNMERYKVFHTLEEQRKYISLLNYELSLINNKKNIIIKNALRVYNHKVTNPSSNLSKRCCDFKLLEEKCVIYANNTKNKFSQLNKIKETVKS